MAADESKIPFGLDRRELKKFDKDLCGKRINHDVKSDFVAAPHLNRIYRKAYDKLFEMTMTALNSGNFAPSAPLTMDVPKTSRMSVSGSRRKGPPFSRPGSILMPKDRVFYQLLGDHAAPIIEGRIDRGTCYSHVFEPESPDMFFSSRDCWGALQKKIRRVIRHKGYKYVMKCDATDYFSNINHHILVNHMYDAGFPKPMANALEKTLMRFTGSRSSRGIIQGVLTSDLLGNFYLSGVDEEMSRAKYEVVRYVDDVYIFLNSIHEAEDAARQLTRSMRSFDLGINESKTYLTTTQKLLADEPDLDDLFEEAISEVESDLEDEDLDINYGVLAEWFEDDVDDDQDREDVEMRAVRRLFDAIDDFPGAIENIERFCLPLFAKFGDDYAVDHVVANLERRPAMAQIYASYLSKYLENANVATALSKGVQSDSVFFDWQRMWWAGALLRRKKISSRYVNYLVDIATSPRRHVGFRAIAAISVWKFGTYNKRRALNTAYDDAGSPYLQSAILYGSWYQGGVEKSNALAQWRAHSDLHELVAKSIS